MFIEISGGGRISALEELILDDCLYLLDGQLKQLTTLIIRIRNIDKSSAIIHNMVSFNKECQP